MTDNNVETTEGELPIAPPEGKPSLVFPTEIKYEDSEGNVSSLYVKEGAISFREARDENGNPTDFVQILIDVGISSENLVIHRYN